MLTPMPAPDPSYDQILLHLFDLVASLAFANALCIGIFGVLIWREAHRQATADPFPAKMFFSDHLYDCALTAPAEPDAIDARLETLTFMLALSLEHLVRECPEVVNANSYVENVAQVGLINNIWNYVWDQLPAERRFFVRDTFRLYYEQRCA